MNDSSTTAQGAQLASLPASQLELLLQVSRTLAVTTDLDALLLRIADAACGLLQCERSSIWLHDPANEQLWTKVIRDCAEIRLPVGAGIVGTAFVENQMVHCPRPYEDPRFSPDNDRRRGFLTRSLLAAPMVDFGGKPVGVIEAVNKVRASFSAHDQSLIRLLADQAGVAIQRHRLQVAAEQAAELRREMRLAREVQESLLPKSLPLMPGYDLAAWATCASITGGDCYDLWHLPDGRLAVLLADASSHGLAAAMIVSLTRTLVRAICEHWDDAHHPHEVLRRVNERLAKDLEPTRFVTAFLAFVSPDGTIQWQSAGQGPILFRRSGASAIESFGAQVPPMNVLREFAEDVPANLRLDPGGSLILISDGIFESFSPTQELFGTARVVSHLEQSPSTPAAECIAQLRGAVDTWQAGDGPTDDQTIIVLNRIR